MGVIKTKPIVLRVDVDELDELLVAMERELEDTEPEETPEHYAVVRRLVRKLRAAMAG